MPERLRHIASTLRTINVHLATSVAALRTHGDEGTPEVLELQSAGERLAQLAFDLDAHADGIDVVDRTVADRMNNFLMSVQTASDLLRGNGEQPDVRNHLRLTVEQGRSTVSDIRRALSML